MNWTIVIATCFAGWLLISPIHSGFSQSVDRPDDSQKFEDYLQTLDLDLLLIELLEFETAQATDIARKRKTAARLAHLYVQEMISNRRLKETDWRSKSELLLKTFPEVSTPALRLAILQSRYVDGEKSFHRWWEQGASPDLMTPMIADWQAIKSDLASLDEDLESVYRDQLAGATAFSEHRQRSSSQLVHTESLMLQADYLRGWTAYFLGTILPDERVTLMREADRHFREFLQIDPQKLLVEISPTWVDLSSDWNVRALAGLAMSQQGLKRSVPSQYCFELIGRHAPDATSRDLRFIWDLNGRLYIDDFSSIDEFLEDAAKANTMSPSGRIMFWNTTLNSGTAVQRRSPTTSRRLMRSGLSGLAREFQASRIEQFMQTNRFTADSDDFLSHWIAGYLDFQRASLLHDVVVFQNSKQHLTRAVELGDSTHYPLDVACCQYLLARIDFQNGLNEQSGNAFLEASLAFGDHAPQLAAESQWLAVRSFSELRKQKPRNLFRVHRAIDQLLNRFPGSTYAQKALFEKQCINVASLPIPQAIEQFEQIRSGDPDFVAARDKILKLRFQEWLDSFSNGDADEPTKRAELIRSEQEFQQLSLASNHSKLKSSLMMVDALLRDSAPDFPTIRTYLNRAESLVDSSESGRLAMAEFHYYEFLFANRSGHPADAEREANWISNHARGSKFEHPALIQLAQLADHRIQSPNVPSPDELEKTIRIFERLVMLSGDSPDILRAEANARVAFARLAELRIMAGQVAEGTQMLESLNQIFPHHQSYLRMLALAWTESRQFSKSIPIWKRLAKGVEPGSELWFESKYHLAFCLFHSGEVEKSRQLFEQTRRLSPNLPDHWRERYDELSGIFQLNLTP